MLADPDHSAPGIYANFDVDHKGHGLPIEAYSSFTRRFEGVVRDGCYPPGTDFTRKIDGAHFRQSGSRRMMADWRELTASRRNDLANELGATHGAIANAAHAQGATEIKINRPVFSLSILLISFMTSSR